MTPSGQQWATACNLRTIPTHTTLVPKACTCYGCRKWIETKEKVALANQELESLEKFMQSIDFEDEDNPENSIKAQIGEIRKELPTSKVPSIEEIDELLTKIKNVSTMSRERKILKNQIKLAQELKTL